MLFKATEEALEVYNNTPCQMLIELKDEDENAKGTIVREVIYNLPLNYVRKNEIDLAESESPRQAKFKLLPVASVPSGSQSS